MFIYAASSPALLEERGLVKLGMTEQPRNRLSEYLTSCPPGCTPSYDISFLGLWKTTATEREDLLDYEEEVHEHFAPQRLTRRIPGDSEWFAFKYPDTAIETIRAFVTSRPWCEREVYFEEVQKLEPTSQYLRRRCPANLRHLRNVEERMKKLQHLQAPVIDSVTQFIGDAQREAGFVIAPCGSGKTVMTARAIALRGLRRVVVCCPSKQIQDQWRATLLRERAFEAENILIVGDAGTTRPDDIAESLGLYTSCLITTYMSSHLLIPHFTKAVELLVLDEAHHMAGVVATQADGIGRTRRLMQLATDLGVRRLSLTFTPRFVTHTTTGREEDGDGDNIVSSDATTGSAEGVALSLAGAPSARATTLSMDDPRVFGTKIAELQIRTMIDSGVLPDYRVWTLRDEDRFDRGVASGVEAKAECLAEAWRAREVRRGRERFVLTHLVVFAMRIQEAEEIERILRDKVGEDTLVLRVSQGDALQEPLARFEKAERAILVNCFVLNEGVDIPRANSVAIMYPKQARGQITQMVLRAGRWHAEKPVFHILLPVLGVEDLSGFEEVLAALATHDGVIRDEIILRSRLILNEDEEERRRRLMRLRLLRDCEDREEPARIMIDEYDSREEEIRRCFANVRARIFPAQERAWVRAFCGEKGVTTSVEYETLREEVPELPEDPRGPTMTWYDFLNPGTRRFRLTGAQFLDLLKRHGIHSSRAYDEWRGVQPTDVRARLPSVQNVTDGFFGRDSTSVDVIVRGLRMTKRSNRKVKVER